jgi:hypothetical protein
MATAQIQPTMTSESQAPPAGTPPPRKQARTRGRLHYDADIKEVQQAATVALTVLRRALVEGVPVTREAITHEASIVFATDPADAASRLDVQAEGLGISSLV